MFSKYYAHLESKVLGNSFLFYGQTKNKSMKTNQAFCYV